ncbi:hypothetical protein FB451DRAFT_1444927 [Mycena latifolia]|nr:hypothetical protein FB451DRAFT_1444927 [Mycena latifolia]
MPHSLRSFPTVIRRLATSESRACPSLSYAASFLHPHRPFAQAQQFCTRRALSCRGTWNTFNLSTDNSLRIRLRSETYKGRLRRASAASCVVLAIGRREALVYRLGIPMSHGVWVQDCAEASAFLALLWCFSASVRSTCVVIGGHASIFLMIQAARATRTRSAMERELKAYNSTATAPLVKDVRAALRQRAASSSWSCTPRSGLGGTQLNLTRIEIRSRILDKKPPRPNGKNERLHNLARATALGIRRTPAPRFGCERRRLPAYTYAAANVLCDLAVAGYARRPHGYLCRLTSTFYVLCESLRGQVRLDCSTYRGPLYCASAASCITLTVVFVSPPPGLGADLRLDRPRREALCSPMLDSDELWNTLRLSSRAPVVPGMYARRSSAHLLDLLVIFARDLKYSIIRRHRAQCDSPLTRIHSEASQGHLRCASAANCVVLSVVRAPPQTCPQEWRPLAEVRRDRTRRKGLRSPTGAGFRGVLTSDGVQGTGFSESFACLLFLRTHTAPSLPAQLHRAGFEFTIIDASSFPLALESVKKPTCPPRLRAKPHCFAVFAVPHTASSILFAWDAYFRMLAQHWKAVGR